MATAAAMMNVTCPPGVQPGQTITITTSSGAPMTTVVRALYNPTRPHRTRHTDASLILAHVVLSRAGAAGRRARRRLPGGSFIAVKAHIASVCTHSRSVRRRSVWWLVGEHQRTSSTRQCDCGARSRAELSFHVWGLAFPQNAARVPSPLLPSDIFHICVPACIPHIVVESAYGTGVLDVS